MRVEIDGVDKVFGAEGGGVEALAGVDLDVSEGEFVSIIGPSGCGKSTLLEVVAGLVAPTRGRIRFDADVVTGPHRAAGVVFQEESTFSWRTVLDNVVFGLQMHGVAKKERLRRAREMIEIVGLEGFEERYPAELSGGMRQRVAIARTLVMNPRVLLMDEPFGALDEQTRLLLGEELLTIWSKTGATVIFITHSIEEAVLLSDRVVAMSARPGHIKRVVDVGLDRPRDTGVIGTPEFGELKGELWEALRKESMKGRER